MPTSAVLAAYNLELSDDGRTVTYDYDTKGDRTGITSLLNDLRTRRHPHLDLDTKQSSSKTSRQHREGARTLAQPGDLSSEMARTGARCRRASFAGRLDVPVFRGVRRRRLRITEVEGVSYGTFIVPGPDAVSADVTPTPFCIRFEIRRHDLRSCGANLLFRDRDRLFAPPRPSRSSGLIILTAGLFVPLHIQHPIWMRLVLTVVTSACSPSSALGRRLREAAKIPCGGGDAADLPRRQFLLGEHAAVGYWRTITLFNPVVYLISGFRSSRLPTSASPSLGMTAAF